MGIVKCGSAERRVAKCDGVTGEGSLMCGADAEVKCRRGFRVGVPHLPNLNFKISSDPAARYYLIYN